MQAMSSPAAPSLLPAPEFTTEALHARLLDEAELPALQAFFDANPLYFQTINGRPAGPDDAREEWLERPPAHLSYSQHWMLGLYERRVPGAPLAGVIVLSWDLCAPGVCHLGLFLIATALHGQGVAAPAYLALEDWARAHGARWMRLGVVCANTRAARFWTRLGFSEVRRREGVDTGGRLNDLSVRLKPLQPEAQLADYLALVPRDRPGAELP